MIPTVVRTWAPRGKTPICRHRYRHEKISVISGLAVSPKRRRLSLYFRFHMENIAGGDAADFLRHLLRHLPGPVIVIWGYAKRALANGRPDDQWELLDELLRLFYCLARSQPHLRGFIRQSNLPPFLPNA